MRSERSFLDRYQKGLMLEGAVLNFTPAYSPEDEDFSLEALETSLAAAEAANRALSDVEIPLADAISDRKALVKRLMPLVTQSLAYVSSNNAWKQRFEVIKPLADKVRGHKKARRSAATPAPFSQPMHAEETAQEKRQRGFLEIAEFFRLYLVRLAAVPGYAPPSAEISLASLTARHTQLDALNTTIGDLSQDLKDAIQARQLAFDRESGLHYVFQGVKIAVKAQYGQASSEFARVKGLRW